VLRGSDLPLVGRVVSASDRGHPDRGPTVLTRACLPGYRLSLCLGVPGCLRVCEIRWYGSHRKRIDLHTGD
jgi:hypothetical protein